MAPSTIVVLLELASFPPPPPPPHSMPVLWFMIFLFFLLNIYMCQHNISVLTQNILAILSQ